MNPQRRVVVGYHGCDRSLLERVVLRGDRLQPSDNAYDWLGKGVYFWENGMKRAGEFAEWKRQRGEIVEPAVIGAHIDLGRCFDLGDTGATGELPEVHARLVRQLRALGAEIPTNRRAGPDDFDLVLRNLDCAVLNHAMAAYDAADGGGLRFQTVRGVFVEGGPAFAGAGIHRKSHVQIAVRELGVILDYFVPRSGL